MIWKQKFTLEGINKIGHQTLVEHLGITFTDFGDDFLIAKMPVDHRTVQPMRLLHGGASAALAETMGSVASVLCLDHPDQQSVVGTELNCSHLRSATSGHVFAKVSPHKLGRRLHNWHIEITNESGKIICISRLTIMVIDQK